MAAQLPDSTALDGELVVWDAAGRLAFERLQNRLARRGAGAVRAAAEWPARFVAFDLLRLSGTDTTGWPYRLLPPQPLRPRPEVASLTEPNAMADQWDLDDESRRLRSKSRTIGEHFAHEQPLLRPPPREVSETGRGFTPRVNRLGQGTAGFDGRRSTPDIRGLPFVGEIVVPVKGRRVPAARRTGRMG
ncbi:MULTISPECIES: hypothetical protein [Streptomyces]|uniref:ATP-dependent DNA ligase family profile domain-containing protein n=2 Tax=Streptomyces TaxID=1883 RepID=A0ABV9J600_9ACTN